VAAAFEGVSNSGLQQAVAAALVELHQITKEMADDAGASASSITRTYLSPRDYLSLIHNFVSCVNSGREAIEDEQLHVNAGFEKLHQTKDNVAELKKGLGAKIAELTEKDILANKKLQRMVGDLNKAETRSGVLLGTLLGL
jgi:dynein heavy chain 1